MIRNRKRSSEREMLIEWGRAEAQHLYWLPRELRERFSDTRVLLTARERGCLEGAIRVWRWDYMLCDLLPLNLSWRKGELPTREMGEIIFDWRNEAFRNAAPSNRLRELARPSNLIADLEFVGRVETMRSSEFDRDRMPKPVLVATNIDGPYHLIEGTARCVAIFLGVKPPIESLPVCIGVGDQFSTWRGYLAGSKSVL